MPRRTHPPSGPPRALYSPWGSSMSDGSDAAGGTLQGGGRTNGTSGCTCVSPHPHQTVSADKACSILPASDKDECEQFLNKFGDQIFQYIVQKLQPDTLCDALGLCSGLLTKKLTAFQPMDDCSVCTVGTDGGKPSRCIGVLVRVLPCCVVRGMGACCAARDTRLCGSVGWTSNGRCRRRCARPSSAPSSRSWKTPTRRNQSLA